MDLLPDKPLKGKFVKSYPLDKIPDNEFIIGEDAPESLVDSIFRLGVLTPIFLIELDKPPHPDIAVMIAAGRRRIKAARRIGLTGIPAIVFPPGTGREVLTLVENQERSMNAAADLEAIETLIKERHATEHDIRLATGMPIQTIRARMKLTTLIPPLKDLLKSGGLPIQLAERICKLPVVEQNRFIVESEGEITNKTVKEFFQAKKESAVSGLPESMFSEPELESSSPPEEVTNLVTYGEPYYEEPVRVYPILMSDEKYVRFLQEKEPDRADILIIGSALKFYAVLKGYKE
jgi:ParB-like chromosome segregation protein Spo0J